MSLPPEFSGLLLHDLGEPASQRILSEIARLPELEWDERHRLVGEFIQLHNTELPGEWPVSIEALEELYYREPKRFVKTLQRFYLP
jgi:hypothetical protein